MMSNIYRNIYRNIFFINILCLNIQTLKLMLQYIYLSFPDEFFNII